MLKIYLLTRIGALSSLFTISFIIGIVVTCVIVFLHLIAILEGSSESFIKKISYIKKFGIVWLVVGVIGQTLCPTKKEMLMIYGGGAILEYCQNSEEIKKIPDNTIRTINLLMEEYIDEMNENNKNK